LRKRVDDGLPPGSHASTFGGNALACAAGLAVLSIFDEEKLIENAHRTGSYLRTKLEAFTHDSRIDAAREVRGRGLLQGLVLSKEVDPLATVVELQRRGVLLSLVGGNVLRFSPPLNVTEAELDEGLSVVESVLSADVR